MNTNHDTNSPNFGQDKMANNENGGNVMERERDTKNQSGLDNEMQKEEFPLLKESRMPKDWTAIEQAFLARREDGITFRAFDPEAEAEPLFKATRNPAFNRYLLWDAPAEWEDVAPCIDKIVQVMRTGVRTTMTVCKEGSSRWSGMATALTFCEGYEIGLLVDPEDWGSPMAVSIIAALMEVLKGEHPEAPVYAHVLADNLPSQGVFRKCGFTKVGRVMRTHARGFSYEWDALRFDPEKQWESGYWRGRKIGQRSNS
jgi:hypothetical protein